MLSYVVIARCHRLSLFPSVFPSFLHRLCFFSLSLFLGLPYFYFYVLSPLFGLYFFPPVMAWLFKVCSEETRIQFSPLHSFVGVPTTHALTTHAMLGDTSYAYPHHYRK